MNCWRMAGKNKVNLSEMATIRQAHAKKSKALE
jgi:hypothetical protein